MFIELPALAIVLLNVIGIPVSHLLIAWRTTRLASERFQPQSPLFRIRTWEKHGTFYERFFRVRAWKDKLPDGASWFSGFAKGSLQSRDQAYLTDFRIETCRGEFSHWVQMTAILLFVIWNPYPANTVIIVYAILSNLPCLVSQRHTRARLNKVLPHRKSPIH